MIGTFVLSQNGKEVARLSSELRTAHAPNARNPNAVRTWDLFLKGGSPGLTMGDSTMFDVKTPNGKIGQCIAAKWNGEILIFNGTGPAPVYQAHALSDAFTPTVMGE